uniref:Uncharacterized protein n=1 Tax=Crocosphaera watsonii WH 0401 TaxID=555881 RepID=T2JFQ7_CROWT|nr:hypothetical protein CWATWH0401_484 [Crocosphaera watsonii WH 0401]
MMSKAKMTTSMIGTYNGYEWKDDVLTVPMTRD